MIEQVYLSLTEFTWSNPLIMSAGIAVIRSVAGWIENSLENGKIEEWEWKKLGETIFRVVPQTLGLTALIGPAGALGTFFTDYIISKITHMTKKK